MKPESLPPPGADLANAIVGVWLLRSREDYDAEGRRLIDPFLGAEPAGCLFFSPTRFAAQFMRRDRDAPAAAGGAASGASRPAAPAAPGSNNSTAVNGYDAYFGSYHVDALEGRIVTLLEGALSPENVGHEYTRDASVAGNRLYIRLTTTRPDGVAITRTLTFERG